VVVLSDHQVLRKAIEFGLRHRFQIEVVESSVNEPGQYVRIEGEDLDLVVMTTLSSTDEPMLALAKASLDVQLGQVPLLIISQQPLGSTFDCKKVFHLHFPFSYDELYTKTAEILSDIPERSHREETAR
jgi:hypothetical protein